MLYVLRIEVVLTRDYKYQHDHIKYTVEESTTDQDCRAQEVYMTDGWSLGRMCSFLHLWEEEWQLFGATKEM